MPGFTAVVPASPFLRQRMAGLSGVARDVIVADLAGASRIWIIGEAPPRDWEASFRVRGRPLPEITVVAGEGDLPPVGANENRVTLPADALPSPDGVRALRDGVPLSPGDQRIIAAGSPEAVTWAILLASLKPGEGWVGRHINRPISFRMSAFLMRWDVSPNWVTWFTLALAVAMAVILGVGGVAALALGGLLYQAVSVIDCVDGDIARVTYRTSRSGAALDTACDMVANLGFVVGMTTGVVRTYGAHHLDTALVLIGVMLSSIALMTLLVRIGPQRGSFDVLRNALERRLAGRVRLQAFVLAAERMFKRDFYVMVLCLLCLTGLAWTIPGLMLAAATIWLLAILWCSPLIAGDKAGELLPAHLKGG